MQIPYFSLNLYHIGVASLPNDVFNTYDIALFY